MIESRIGIGLSKEVDVQLAQECAGFKISKGDFVSAMLLHLGPDVRRAAIEAYMASIEAAKAEKKAAKKELRKKLATLTPEEIETVLAARQA